MLDWFIQGFKPTMQHKVLKDNPSTFLDTCMLTERIGMFDVYLVECIYHCMLQYNNRCKSMQYDPKGYAPTKLDAAFAIQIKIIQMLLTNLDVNLMVYKIQYTKKI